MQQSCWQRAGVGHPVRVVRWKRAAWSSAARPCAREALTLAQSFEWLEQLGLDIDFWQQCYEAKVGRDLCREVLQMEL